jgi:hypothetical protein
VREQPRSEFRAIVNVELVVDPPAVGDHRVFADTKLACDTLIPPAVCQKEANLRLAATQMKVVYMPHDRDR